MWFKSTRSPFGTALAILWSMFDIEHQDYEAQEDENRIYNIPSQNLGKLRHQIDILNRRATKLGVDRIELIDHGREIVVHKDDITAFETVVVYHKVEIRGTTPKFDGWTFAGVLEWVGDTNVIRKAPTVTREFPEFRQCRPACDHCKAKRDRKETFILTHDDGRVIQLGRQCIKDFLGHADPKQLASWAEILFKATQTGEDEERLSEGGSREDREIPVEHFLNHVAEWTLRDGFKTRKQCENTPSDPTSLEAIGSMFPRSAEDYARLRKIQWSISEEAVALAKDAVAHVREVLGSKEDKSDFEHNLFTLTHAEVIGWKNVGMLAYAIGWHLREQEKAAKEAVEAKAKRTFEYWGKVGDRVKEQELVYVGESSFDGYYGTTFIIRFDLIEDGKVYRLVWKTGTGADLAMDIGDTVKATFTVKEHSEFRDMKQTLITRCIKFSMVKPAHSPNPETTVSQDETVNPDHLG